MVRSDEVWIVVRLFYLLSVVRAALDFSNETANCTQDGDLHEFLCKEWEARRLAGLMVEGNETLRNLQGNFGHILQAAYHRAGKRTMNRATLTSTRMPFDPDKFHFGKVRPEEVLMCFDPWNDETQHCSRTCDLQNSAAAVVLVQLRPVCRNHILVVPDMQGLHPQNLHTQALLVGLAFASRASHRMWFSFNSIGAGASVNHLHWQGFFPGSRRGDVFPLESHLLRENGIIVAAEPRDHVSLWLIPEWPLQGWMFLWTETLGNNPDDKTLTSHPSAKSVEHQSRMEKVLSERVMGFIAHLQNRDIAHNVHIGFSGTRVFVFPRRIMNSQGVDASMLQVAGHEVLGWWIVNRQEDFENLESEDASKFLSSASLDNYDRRLVLQALSDSGWSLNEDALRFVDS